MKNVLPTLTNKIMYWFTTLWLALGMFATGLAQLLHWEQEGALGPPGVWGIKQLGYPVYFLTIIGVWKMLGVLAILMPKFPLLKEWAYAGFFFLMTGAIFSHIASNSSIIEMLPAMLLLILTIISWYFRPADRRIISNSHRA